MNSAGLSKGKCTSRQMAGLLKTPRDLQMLFAAVTHTVKVLRDILTLRAKIP
jgi:hypothetical protein